MGKRKPKSAPKGKNSLHTLPLPSSSVLMFVDSTTFASPSSRSSGDNIPKPLQPTDLPLYTRKRRCILHCKNPKVLHRVPTDEARLELWRKKLKLKVLRKTHRVCGKHFKKNVSEKYRRLHDWIVPDTPEASDIEDESTTPQKNHELQGATQLPKIWKITRIPEDNIDTRKRPFKKSTKPISTEKIKKDILACK